MLGRLGSHLNSETPRTCGQNRQKVPTAVGTAGEKRQPGWQAERQHLVERLSDTLRSSRGGRASQGVKDTWLGLCVKLDEQKGLQRSVSETTELPESVSSKLKRRASTQTVNTEAEIFKQRLKV